MRVCHVCSGHGADDGRVFHRECVALAEAGYDVHLIAKAPGDRPYRDHGVMVHPLAEPGSRLRRLIRRTRVARMAARLDPDLFHVHEPELLGPVIARAGARPVIWDVHESYLDILMNRHWIPRWLRPIARRAWDARERQLVRRCAGVVVAMEPIANRYRAIHERVELVANYPEIVWDPQLPNPERNFLACLFTGTIAPNRGISQVLAALALLKARNLKVPLELAGRPMTDGYLCDLLQEADRLGIRDQVHYHGILSKAQTIALQQRGGIGLVPHLSGGNNEAAWPVKLFEFMAAGLPLIYSDISRHREIAGTLCAGIPVDPEKPEQFACAIEQLVSNHGLAQRLGEAGMRTVREKFNWNIERAKLLNLYRELFEPPGCGRAAAN